MAQTGFNSIIRKAIIPESDIIVRDKGFDVTRINYPESIVLSDPETAPLMEACNGKQTARLIITGLTDNVFYCFALFGITELTCPSFPRSYGLYPHTTSP